MNYIIIESFRELIGIDWQPAIVQNNSLFDLIKYADNHGYLINQDYKKIFIEAVNQKLDINKKAFQHILDTAFLMKAKLNYTKKTPSVSA